MVKNHFVYLQSTLRIKVGGQASFNSIHLKDKTKHTFTCSKPTIETLEKDMKYVKANIKNTRTTSMNVVLASLVLFLNVFYFFFYISIVEFQQVNVCWG